MTTSRYQNLTEICPYCGETIPGPATKPYQAYFPGPHSCPALKKENEDWRQYFLDISLHLEQMARAKVEYAPSSGRFYCIKQDQPLRYCSFGYNGNRRKTMDHNPAEQVAGRMVEAMRKGSWRIWLGYP